MTVRSFVALLVIVFGLSACVDGSKVQHDVTPESSLSGVVAPTLKPAEIVPAPTREPVATIDTSWNEPFSIVRVDATPSIDFAGRFDYSIIVWDPAKGETPMGLRNVQLNELARIPMQQLIDESKRGPIQACIYAWGPDLSSTQIDRVEPGFCGTQPSQAASVEKLLSVPVTLEDNRVIAMQGPREPYAAPAGSLVREINFIRANLLSDGNAVKWVFFDGSKYHEFYGLRAQDVHFDILGTIEGVEFEEPLCITIASGEGIKPTVTGMQPFVCTN